MFSGFKTWMHSSDHCHMLQGSIETWMLLEYADRGSLEQAIQARQFHRRADATLDLVSHTFRQAIQAIK